MLNNRKKFLTITLISSLFISMIPKRTETIDTSTKIKIGVAFALFAAGIIVCLLKSNNHDNHDEHDDRCTGGSCSRPTR